MAAARSLLHHLPTKPTTTLSPLIRHRRNHSTQPETTDEEKAALRRLEEAVHRVLVKKAQPGWIPLVPGGSYWVPPSSAARGFAQVVAGLVKDSGSLKVDDRLWNSNRGWPSSAQFFIGTSHSPLELEGEITVKRSKNNEEEEG